MTPRPILPLLLLTLAGMFPPHAAHAQDDVNRCRDASGRPVFTDRRCEDIGSREAAASAPTAAGLAGVPACVRKLSELVAAIRQAATAHDVNVLAAVYRWQGLSPAAGEADLARLESLTQRPLLDIEPIRPGDAAPAAAEPAPATEAPAAAASADGSARGTLPRPIGLRLRQTLGDGHTPASTDLRLHHENGCFSVSLSD